MLPIPTIIIVAILGLLLLTVVVYISTGSFTAVLVVMLLAAGLFFILQKIGVLKIDLSKGLDIGFYEKAPAPSPPKSVIPPKAMPIEKKEVFYVSGNDYTYEDAPAVCAAYDSELATYDEITEAYSAGAEWCGYGWTQGGMALFPTQDATWQALQGEVDIAKRTACGRPGVNGGYFDPATKFGVNCYGVKPSNMGIKLPLPLPGTDNAGFQNLVNKFKSMIKKMSVSPFNRDGWSEWNLESHKIPSSI